MVCCKKYYHIYICSVFPERARVLRYTYSTWHLVSHKSARQRQIFSCLLYKEESRV